jgi:hypothetical protein
VDAVQRIELQVSNMRNEKASFFYLLKTVGALSYNGASHHTRSGCPLFQSLLHSDTESVDATMS